MTSDIGEQRAAQSNLWPRSPGSDTSKFLTEAARANGLQRKLRAATNSDELVKLTRSAGCELDENELSSLMRNISKTELQKHGLPDWAIMSMFQGDAVCW
jgi:hypothetical protein